MESILLVIFITAPILILIFMHIKNVRKGVAERILSARRIKKMWGECTFIRSPCGIGLFLLMCGSFAYGFYSVWKEDHYSLDVLIITVILFYSIFGAIAVLFSWMLEKACNYLIEIKDMTIGYKLVIILLYDILYFNSFWLNAERTEFISMLCWGSNLIILCICIWILIRIIYKKCRVVDERVISNRITFIFTMFFFIFMSLVNLVETTRVGWAGSFRNMEGIGDSIYFVLITFATIGYGDITPLSPLAKIDACLISLTGMLFLITFINVYLNRDSGGNHTDEKETNEN